MSIITPDFPLSNENTIYRLLCEIKFSHKNTKSLRVVVKQIVLFSLIEKHSGIIMFLVFKNERHTIF